MSQQEPVKTELELIQELDPKLLENIVKLIRAFEGLPPDPETAISKLIDMKNVLERSRFPTYPIIQRQVYLRLLHKYYGDVAESCKDWADFEAQALIEYKGAGRQEFVDMNKAPQGQPQNEFYLGGDRRQGVEEPKRHWWSRGPKREEGDLEQK